jgi:hypothetical protein
MKRGCILTKERKIEKKMSGLSNMKVKFDVKGEYSEEEE